MTGVFPVFDLVVFGVCGLRESVALFPQRILEVDGNAVLLEQVSKGFVGQFLKRPHAVACKLGQLVERIIVEGDQFAQARTTPGVERM